MRNLLLSLKRLFSFSVAIEIFFFCSCTSSVDDRNGEHDRFELDLNRYIDLAEGQLQLLIHSIDSVSQISGREDEIIPISESSSGLLLGTDALSWRSGFFPGCLWYMYQLTNNIQWMNEAANRTWAIESASNHSQHDLGFMFNCSFGKAYTITKEERYKEVLLTAANTLAGRYSEKVGCLLTWNPFKNHKFPVLIDAMMNLELLFEATKLTGDSTFYYMADSHATKTMNNHFRKNNSSYHIVSYNTTTGEPEEYFTAQGYSDESYWSRGQSWGLYGFTMCYRYTKNRAYLQKACDIADFLLSLSYDDSIPYWDMADPSIPNTYKDASAAAIMASALLELSEYVEDPKLSLYRNFAFQQIKTLAVNYTAKKGTHYGFQLLHSTAGKDPTGETSDKPTIYADYYYLECIYRISQLNINVK